MKKYLVACDIDGTLLSHDGKLAQETIDTLHKVSDLGHVVVIATGRPLSGALQIYQSINIDYPIITDNGASIDFPGHIEFAKQRTFIPNKVMKTLFAYSKPFTTCAFFDRGHHVYAYKYDKKLEKIFAGLSRGHVIDCEFTDLDVEPSGMIFFIENESKEKFENWIITQYPDTLSFRQWGSDNKSTTYEVYLKHVSKASAIQHLLNYYHIDPDNTIAFGDGINDLEMIRDMRFGVAMKNAVKELKDVAFHVTKETSTELGVSKYLKHFFDL